MKQWPAARFTQAFIAHGAAAVLAVCVFVWVNETHFERYSHEYPNDGQNGLGAMMDALEAGGLTLVGISAALYVIQRAAVARANPDSNSPTE